MKKLFTLCTAMLLVAMASAQKDETFQFVDANGNVITNGSTITVTEINAEGQMVVPLYVKNNSGGKAAASLYETIDDMPSGEWQTCAFGNCKMLTETGYSAKSVVDADYNASIQTEWIPEAGKYATWEAKLQIHVYDVITKSQFGITTEVAGNTIIGYGPVVTVRFEYDEANQQQEKAEAWWGYVGSDDGVGGLGVNKAETYDCAAFFPGDNEVAAGKTIKAVRFILFSTNVKNVKVWIAKTKPNNIDEGAIEVVKVERPVTGINEVKLTTPYTIGSEGVYVGYTFTVTKLQNDGDYYPVAVTGSDLKNALILRTSSTVPSWDDLNGQGFGRLYLQMLLEGDFPYKNAASPAISDLGESVAIIGGTGTAYLPITNKGTENLQSIDYTISVDGVAGPEQHLDLESAITFASTKTVNLQVDADDTASQKVKTLTITKVNGVANEFGVKTTNFTLTTVAELVHRGIVVEEFTGTTCGWCPRGMVGMEKMRNEFGDNFVGIAIHRYTTSTSQDAMYISSYNHVSFGGAPSCRINRGDIIDPYYGSGNDIFDDFRAELAIPAKVAVDVTGKWNEDSTKVEATATLNCLIPEGNFKIEYVLIADGLSGTGTAWNQTNYYYQYTASQMPDDLADFAKGGKYGRSSVSGLTFNDVAIAVAKSTQTSALGTLTLGEPVTNTYTLSMPTNAALKKAIDKENVAVVALVIDSATGRIANAVKRYMKEQAANFDVNGDGTVDVADISTVISVMAGSSDVNADVNGDGVVDVADISSIISKMAAMARMR